jgi:hypothetical protein
LLSHPSFGADSTKVIGTWKLVSHETENQASGTKEPGMGRNPTGYAVFKSDGRVFLLITGDGRKPAKTAEERAELFTTLMQPR